MASEGDSALGHICHLDVGRGAESPPGSTYLVWRDLFSDHQGQKGIGRRRGLQPRAGHSPPWWLFQGLWGSAPPPPPWPGRTESVCFLSYSFSIKYIFVVLNLWNLTIHIKRIQYQFTKTICLVRRIFFPKPQQITEKLLELAKNSELNSAKIRTFPTFIPPVLKSTEYTSLERSPLPVKSYQTPISQQINDFQSTLPPFFCHCRLSHINLTLCLCLRYTHHQRTRFWYSHNVFTPPMSTAPEKGHSPTVFVAFLAPTAMT